MNINHDEAMMLDVIRQFITMSHHKLMTYSTEHHYVGPNMHKDNNHPLCPFCMAELIYGRFAEENQRREE